VWTGAAHDEMVSTVSADATWPASAIGMAAARVKRHFFIDIPPEQIFRFDPDRRIFLDDAARAYQWVNFVETNDASQGKYPGKVIEQVKVLPWHN